MLGDRERPCDILGGVARSRRRLLTRFSILILLVPGLSAQNSSLRVVYIPYADAQPILVALADELPAELKNASDSQRLALWPEWVKRQDAEIRARLAQGDEDSIVNFLLFGTSFTRQPRVTDKELMRLAPQAERASPEDSTPASFGLVLQARVEALIKALVAPGSSERLLFVRRVLDQEGHNVATAAGRASAKKYLLESLARVLSEQRGYANALQSARQLGDPSEEFAERSRLYRDRGLSLDTSLLPNFALEESLKAMQVRGLLAGSSVRRVAIVGPGLDFTDKQEGYDFYPQQTVQPFAVVDTLLRLGLSKADGLEVTTLDISPRVNAHVKGARERARRGISYTVQLPRDPDRRWKPEAVRYWQRFGDQIGMGVPPVPVPAGVSKLDIRAVRIRPSIVLRVRSEDLNIVLQRLEGSGAGAFDLIIATNIFVYYGLFEQSLALTNVQHLLRPGGFLLSNNALLELPSSQVHSVDYLTVVYSDRPDDGDHIVWYRKAKE